MAAAAMLHRLLRVSASVVTVTVLVTTVCSALADPVRLELGPRASDGAVAERRQQLGLEGPAWERVASSLAGAIQGDLGHSIHHDRPVRSVLADAIPSTLAYTIPGFVLSFLCSLLGAAVGARRRGALDRLFLALATVAMCLSGIVVVVIARDGLAHGLGWFPVTGWPLGHPVRAGLPWIHLALPCLVFAFIHFGPDLRHFRALFCQAMVAPWLDGARARGISEPAILRHVLHSVSGAIVTRAGARLPYWIGGSVVIEAGFNIPGVGHVLVDGLRAADVALVQGVALVLSITALSVQFVTELVASRLDPRLRR